MKRIAMFSGGKDSSCLVHLLLDTGQKIDVVFVDTGWELPETIKHVENFNELYLDGKLIVLKSKKYDGMIDLVNEKRYMPTVHQRFCTQLLKVQPIIKYLETINGDFEIYNGVRRSESRARSIMDERVYDNVLGCWMYRPLLDWTDDDVIKY